MAELYSKDSLPELAYELFAKTRHTLAVKIVGTFHCLTSEGNVASCDDGWLAIDSRGHPYPVNASEFADTYAKVDETSLNTP